MALIKLKLSRSNQYLDACIKNFKTAGLASARARRRIGGQPRKVKTSRKVALARRMFTDKSHSIPEICSTLGISRATLYRYVKKAEPPVICQNTCAVCLITCHAERWIQTTKTNGEAGSLF